VSAEAHAADLFETLSYDTDGLSWTYTGPPAYGGGAAVTMEQVVAWLRTDEAVTQVYAILVPER
jgi:hypothetical protein